MSAVNRDI